MQRRQNKNQFLAASTTRDTQSGKGGVALLIMLLVLIGFASLGLANRQRIVDYLRLRDYKPSATVSALATQDTMTDYTRNIFYVNDPQISDKAAFRTSCPNNGGETTIVLGCYHGFQNGIYVLQVTDPRLDGVVQVTAAHETLHAIYDRLSKGERTKVDAQLLDYYQHDLKDQRIKDIIDAYKKSEPNDVVNEMHSIFGTEIATLPTGLEQYYAKYFTNRAQIAGFAAKYQTEFTSRQSAVAKADTELAAVKTQITNAEASLKAQETIIATIRAQLDSQRDSGAIAAYNAGVPAYNTQVNSYNDLVASTKELITHYNTLVASRNAIAVEQGELASELNASAEPIAK